MKILFLHGWTSTPGGRKPTFLKEHGHEVINPALPDDDFEEAVRIAQAEFDQHQPDVVVGSSRGGAVAINIEFKDTPLVLLCPAWRKWGTATTVKPNTVILHSRKDDVIPVADSEELIANSGLPKSTLIEVGNDHRLADPEPLKAMLMSVRCSVKPASFSGDFPYAYHVLPLHAFKSIAASRTLLSKSDLQTASVEIKRSSTANVDNALGLSQFIHFYLPRNLNLSFDSLSILKTQMKESLVSPFPHIVMVIPTSELTDWQCGICNFNTAVSRPAYGQVRGGNHARGMAPQNIVKHWLGFKRDTPDRDRCRRSYWHDGIAVPVLLRHQITQEPSSVGFRTKSAELLLRSPFEIQQPVQVFAFSNADCESLSLLNHGFAVHLNECEQFAWYAEGDRVEPQLREAINQYFQSDDGQLPQLDYDGLRPSG